MDNILHQAICLEHYNLDSDSALLYIYFQDNMGSLPKHK